MFSFSPLFRIKNRKEENAAGGSGKGDRRRNFSVHSGTQGTRGSKGRGAKHANVPRSLTLANNDTGMQILAPFFGLHSSSLGVSDKRLLAAETGARTLLPAVLRKRASKGKEGKNAYSLSKKTRKSKELAPGQERRE